MNEKESMLTRRVFFQRASKVSGLVLLGGLGGKLLSNTARNRTVWQIDPNKCIQCGNCATSCVLAHSASRCVHDLGMCGYCRICSGFNPPDALQMDEAAENQMCPVGAITRRYVEEPYYEYTIDRERCIGCAKCVKGCTSFGNGSLFMQIQRDICVDCNECSIAMVCEGKAIHRVPAALQYIPKRTPSA